MNKIYIIFNKITRTPSFITDSIDGILKDGDLYKAIEIEGDEFNLARFRWEGTFDDGNLIDLFAEKKAIVTEEEINQKYYELFFRKYPLEKVIFNLVKSIRFEQFSMRDDNMMHLDESYQMQQFLIKLMDKKMKEFEFFQNSKNHIFESEKDQELRLVNAFKIEKK